LTSRPRLNRAALGALPPGVERPGYALGLLTTGIVHLGLGAFHRAHQALYTDMVMRPEEPVWGISGVSLRSEETARALAPQDGIYTILERGAETRCRVIGCLTGTIGPTGLTELARYRLADPAVRIVSLTVTEKAYCRDPDGGGLDRAHPAIEADLRAPRTPRSAIGIIVEGLRRRLEDGAPPLAVVSCDNLTANGRELRRIVLDYAAALSPGLAARIDAVTRFPCTMVDRIVPATTDADRDTVAELTGQFDAWPVVGEPFRQWVIEDDFPSGRPAWEEAGAELVADVRPFEDMKLRLLNGAHTAIACIGLLCGLQTVSEAMACDVVAGFADRLMQDAAETLDPAAALDWRGYRTALLERFRNPGLRHLTAQIASDTSQKLSARILPVVAARLAAGRPIDRHAFVMAAWIRLLEGSDEGGRRLEISDPGAGPLRTAAGAPAAVAAADILGRRNLFGETGGDRRVVAAVSAALEDIRCCGVLAAAERCGRSVP